MKSSTLIKLILALALLGGLAYWTTRKAPVSANQSAAVAGKALAIDLNGIDGFIVASGTQTVTLAKTEGTWTVETLWNYPADFDRVVDQLRQLGALKVGNIMPGGENQLAEFGLAPDAGVTNEDGLVVVSFFGEGGKALSEVALGKPRLSRSGSPMSEGYPDGQFIRVDQGPVMLVDQYLGGIPRQPQDWLDKDLINAARAEVRRVVIKRPDGSTYEVLQETAGTFTVPGLADGEEMKTAGAELLAGCLQNLALTSVADPKLADDKTGLNQAVEYMAELRDGTIYRIKVGNAQPDQFSRYARISADFTVPASPTTGITTNEQGEVVDPFVAFKKQAEETARKAVEQNSRLSKRLFLLPESACLNLTLPRDQLIGPKPSPTNTPPAVASESVAPVAAE